MKKTIIGIVVAGFIATVAAVGFSQSVAHAQYSVDPCSANSSSAICNGSANSTAGDPDALTGTIGNIVNVLLWIVGIVSVIVIIIGGIMYATSAGDSGRTKKAKDAILYAVIGLAVAVFAYAIVNFVVDQI